MEYNDIKYNFIYLNNLEDSILNIENVINNKINEKYEKILLNDLNLNINKESIFKKNIEKKELNKEISDYCNTVYNDLVDLFPKELVN